MLGEVVAVTLILAVAVDVIGLNCQVLFVCAALWFIYSQSCASRGGLNEALT